MTVHSNVLTCISLIAKCVSIRVNAVLSLLMLNCPLKPISGAYVISQHAASKRKEMVLETERVSSFSDLVCLSLDIWREWDFFQIRGPGMTYSLIVSFFLSHVLSPPHLLSKTLYNHNALQHSARRGCVVSRKAIVVKRGHKANTKVLDPVIWLALCILSG